MVCGLVLCDVKSEKVGRDYPQASSLSIDLYSPHSSSILRSLRWIHDLGKRSLSLNFPLPSIS